MEHLIEVLTIFLKVLNSVQSIHSCDLVERELNPSNIVKVIDQYKIIGFDENVEGISNGLTDSVGKLEYYAPEVCITRYSNIFSLGCTLLQLLTNCPLKLDTKFVQDINITKFGEEYPFFTSLGTNYFCHIVETDEGERKLHYAIEKLINCKVDSSYGVNTILNSCVTTMIQREPSKRLDCFQYITTLNSVVQYLKGEISKNEMSSVYNDSKKEITFERGFKLFEQKDYMNACEIFDKININDNIYTDINTLQFTCRTMLGDFTRCEKIATEHAKMTMSGTINRFDNTKEIDLKINQFSLFYMHFKLGHIDEALKLFNDLVEKDTCSGLYLMASQLYIQQGDYEKFGNSVDNAYKQDNYCKAAIVYKALYSRAKGDLENVKLMLSILKNPNINLTEPYFPSSLNQFSNFDKLIPVNHYPTICVEQSEDDSVLEITVEHYCRPDSKLKNWNVKKKSLTTIISFCQDFFQDPDIDHLIEPNGTIILRESMLRHKGRYMAQKKEQNEMNLNKGSQTVKVFETIDKNIVKVQVGNDTDNFYALKIIKRDDQCQDNFMTLCTTIQSIDSKYIVKYLSFGKYKNDLESYYILMPIAKCNLREYWNSLKHEDKTIPHALSIFIQVMNGVCCLHQHNIIHKDLKPENILYFSDGTFKVCDFNDSKILTIHERNITLDDQGTTDLYHPPEIILGGDFTTTNGQAIDNFSSVCLFLDVLFGIQSLTINDKNFCDIIASTNSEQDVHSHVEMLFKTSKFGSNSSLLQLFKEVLMKHPSERLESDKILEKLHTIKREYESIQQIPLKIPLDTYIEHTMTNELTTIDFSNYNNFNEDMLKSVLSNCSKLECLNICGMNITEFGRVLGPNKCKCLKTLILNHCTQLEKFESLDDECILERVELNQCPNLKSIHIISKRLKQLELYETLNVKDLTLLTETNPFEISSISCKISPTLTNISISQSKFVEELCKQNGTLKYVLESNNQYCKDCLLDTSIQCMSIPILNGSDTETD